MKKMMLMAAAALLVASPVLACDYHKEGKGDQASVSPAPSTAKKSLKASKSKAAKPVASAQAKSAKI